MAVVNTDRNLLFGILALQMDFIGKSALITAMHAWVLAKSKPLGAILVEQGALTAERQSLLEALVGEHLRMHGNDPEKSLAAVSSVEGLRKELHAVGDTDLEASLVHLPRSPKTVADPYVTQMPSQGSSSSVSLRFQVLRPHAKGGLGEVHVALDEELHREVALKQIQEHHADDAESRSRFLLEAEITGGLEHPGIVPVYSLGTYADGRPYYAMRFIRGDSLREAIDRYHRGDRPASESGLELRQLLGRFIDVCNAITYAHSRGVLHRDLKPGNIMLGKYGETLVVDWGLAKPLDRPMGAAAVAENTLTLHSGKQSTQTMMGSTIGTPSFMSPEQAAGRLDKLGPASDVYSLGATLYYLLTGKPPFSEPDVGAILNKVQRGDFPPPRQVKPDTSRPLEAICLKAMALVPEDRYASASDLADDIEHWLADEPVTAWPDPWTVRSRRWISRHRTLVTGAVSALLVAAAGLTIATLLLTAANERERQARDLAEERATEAKEQRKKAEENFRLARQAVDRYHTEVSESILLNEPGMQPLRKKLLEAAREFYDRFVQERRDDPGVKAELGKALFRLAQITGEIDSRHQAIDLHKQALAIFLALDSPEAKTPETRHDLATCRHHLGRLHRLTDQLEPSKKYYQEAITTWEGLLRDDPRSAAYQADLARSQLGLGNVHQLTRDLKQAVDLYKKALEIRTRLADQDRANVEYQRDLAVSHNNLAMVYRAEGQTKQAEESFRAALAIQKRLAQDQPHLSQYRNDLARTHFNLAELAGPSDQARADYNEALALWKELTSKHPAVTVFQTTLADTYSALAASYQRGGMAEKALEPSRQALAIKQRLADTHPKVPGFQRDLGVGHYHLGDVYRANGQADKAEGSYRDALRIQERLAREGTAIAHYQADLARTQNNLGLLHAESKKRKEAEEAFGKALASWEKLVEAHPKEVEFAVGLSTTCYNLANLKRTGGEQVAALDWYSRASRAVEDRFAASTQPTVRQARGNAHWKHAETLSELGRYPQALVEWDQAIALAGPANLPWFRIYRNLTVARSGAHAQAVAEAAKLLPKADGKGELLYQLTCIYAASAGTVEDPALAEQYAGRAMELLGKARAAGYFRSSENLGKLNTAADLGSLRKRPEFKKILSELPATAKVPGP